MFGGSNGNCSTMSVVEDFFEKFEKGELRTVEQEVASGTTAADGTVEVTVEDLVSIEEVAAVLYWNDTAGKYQPIAADAADTETFAATSSNVADNVVTLQFYTADAGAVFAPTDSETDYNKVKVVARGY